MPTDFIVPGGGRDYTALKDNLCLATILQRECSMGGGCYLEAIAFDWRVDLAQSDREAEVPTARHDAKVLSSWKEIAAYFGKGVRTVQRWEHQFGLPVSRPQKAQKGVVLASTDDLDRWLATTWAQQNNPKPSAGDSDKESAVAASIRDHKRLRQANRELMFDLSRAMEGLRGESQALTRSLTASTGTQVTSKQETSSRSTPTRKRPSA